MPQTVESRKPAHAQADDNPAGLWTEDLYLGAYLLCRGFEIADLAVTGNNGKTLVAFHFDGDTRSLRRVSAEYAQGRATANVALLKAAMTVLKDLLFEKVRKAEHREKMLRLSQRAGLGSREKSRNPERTACRESACGGPEAEIGEGGEESETCLAGARPRRPRVE